MRRALLLGALVLLAGASARAQQNTDTFVLPGNAGLPTTYYVTATQNSGTSFSGTLNVAIPAIPSGSNYSYFVGVGALWIGPTACTLADNNSVSYTATAQSPYDGQATAGNVALYSHQYTAGASSTTSLTMTCAGGTITDASFTAQGFAVTFGATVSFDAGATGNIATGTNVNTPTSNQSAGNELGLCYSAPQHTLTAPAAGATSPAGNWIGGYAGASSDGQILEFQLFANATGVACSFTQNTSGTANAIFAAYKLTLPQYGPGTGGSVPVRATSFGYPNMETGGTGGTGPDNITSATLYFPGLKDGGIQLGDCWVIPFAYLVHSGTISGITATTNIPGDTFSTALAGGGTTENGNVVQAIYGNMQGNETQVTITFTGGGTANYFVPQATEIEQTSCVLDVAAAVAGGTSTTPAAGSITTLTNNDYVVNASFALPTCHCVATSITAGTSPAMNPVIENRWSGGMVEDQVQSTAGAINPNWTISPSSAWASLTLAFKEGSFGTPTPVGTTVYLRDTVSTAQYTTVGSSTSVPFQFPCSGSGSTVAGMWQSVEGAMTAISDTASNSYTIGTPEEGSTTGGITQGFRVNPSSCSSPLTTTITNDMAFGTTPAETVVVVEGFTAFAHDTDAMTFVNSGTVTTPNTWSSAITLAQNNEFVMVQQGIDHGTMGGAVTSTGGTCQQVNETTNPESSPSPVFQNNYFSDCIFTSSGTKTFVFTANDGDNPLNVSDWAQAYEQLTATTQIGGFLPGP